MELSLATRMHLRNQEQDGKQDTVVLRSGMRYLVISVHNSLLELLNLIYMY